MPEARRSQRDSCLWYPPSQDGRAGNPGGDRSCPEWLSHWIASLGWPVWMLAIGGPVRTEEDGVLFTEPPGGRIVAHLAVSISFPCHNNPHTTDKTRRGVVNDLHTPRAHQREMQQACGRSAQSRPAPSILSGPHPVSTTQPLLQHLSVLGLRGVS